MKENIEKKLTLHDLSNFSAYSNSHLTTLFKDRTGYSPIDYFISLKIQKACQYLDHSTMKITQISPKVGMEDPLYFSRIFQKKMGMSPSEYRKKEKG
jgi:AraC-like DNA-binding protein